MTFYEAFLKLNIDKFAELGTLFFSDIKDAKELDINIKENLKRLKASIPEESLEAFEKLIDVSRN